jgi:hypothetical protein
VVWLAVGIVVLAGLLLVAEPWVRHRGVQEAADRIAEALDADVELHVVGRPLLWHLVRRELPHVVVVADALPVHDGRATLDRLRVELDTVRLVGRADDRRVTAEAGRFHLTLTTGELLRMVTLPSYLLGLEVVPTGLRLQTLGGMVVDATVQLDPDSLLVRPASSMLRMLPQPSFRLPLPTWPYGASVEGMTLHLGEVEAWGVLDPTELTFPAVVPWGRVAP